MPLIPQTLVPKPHTPIVVGPISHTRSSSGLQTPHPEGGGPLPCAPQAHDPKAHIPGVGVPPSHAPFSPVPLPQEPGSGSSRFPARWPRGQGCAQRPFQGHKQTKGPWDHRPGITHPLGSQGRDGAGLTPESQRGFTGRAVRSHLPDGRGCWGWGGDTTGTTAGLGSCAPQGAHHHQPGSHHFIGFHCYFFYGNIQNTKEKKQKTTKTPKNVSLRVIQ